MEYIIGMLISGVICGFVTKYIANSKGYEGGFAWGFWLGIIGILVVGFRPNQEQPQVAYHSRYGSSDYRMSSSSENNSYRPRSVANKGWTCTCGSHNPSSMDYCMSCRKTREEATEEKIECKHCGANNKKSNIICFACGKPVDGSEPVIEKNKDEEVVAKEKITEPTDYTEILNKIALLHEQGILTDDEFTQKKADILNKI